MAIRLPKADTFFKVYTDTELLNQAQFIHNKLVTNSADFPDLPLTVIALQTAITAYRTAAATAIKGSKAQTQAKTDAKEFLIQLLRQLAYYVTQVAQSNYTVNKNLQNVNALILESGFKISKTPGISNAVTGIDIPIVRHAISKVAGSLYFVLRNYKKGSRGKNTYQINYRTSEIPAVPPATTPTPAGPWKTFTFTSSNKVTVTGLTSGLFYDYEIAVIGRKNTKLNQQNPVNYTPIAKIVVT